MTKIQKIEASLPEGMQLISREVNGKQQYRPVQTREKAWAGAEKMARGFSEDYIRGYEADLRESPAGRREERLDDIWKSVYSRVRRRADVHPWLDAGRHGSFSRRLRGSKGMTDAEALLRFRIAAWEQLDDWEQAANVKLMAEHLAELRVLEWVRSALESGTDSEAEPKRIEELFNPPYDKIYIQVLQKMGVLKEYTFALHKEKYFFGVVLDIMKEHLRVKTYPSGKELERIFAASFTALGGKPLKMTPKTAGRKKSYLNTRSNPLHTERDILAIITELEKQQKG